MSIFLTHIYCLASEDIGSSPVVVWITMTITVCGFSTHKTSGTHSMALHGLTEVAYFPKEFRFCYLKKGSHGVRMSK